MLPNLETAKKLFKEINSMFGNVYYIDARMEGDFALMRINEHNLSRSDGYLIVCDSADEDLYDELAALSVFIETLLNYYKELAGKDHLCQDDRFGAANSKFGNAYDIERGTDGDYRLIHYNELNPDENEVIEDCPQDEDLYESSYAYRYYSEWLEDFHNEMQKKNLQSDF